MADFFGFILGAGFLSLLILPVFLAIYIFNKVK
jgi:hypothetical protein